MDTSLLILLTLLVFLLFIVVIITSLRKSQGNPDIAAPLQALAQSLNSNQSRIEVLFEKVAQLERIQNNANHHLVALGNGLTETSTAARGLVETANSIRDELSHAKSGLSELQAHNKARQDIERSTAESIKRLEAIIAGTQSKGAAGENILELMFAKLPAEWQERNFTVGNKTVEFGLRLPNKLVLPIDSKWAATHLLEQFINCQDTNEQQVLKVKIEKAVLDKAKEVQKYIDPNLTANFGVAVVPDAIYDLCCGILTEALKMRVALVSYSMFVPYILLVIESSRRTALNIDETKLNSYLQVSQDSITALQMLSERRLSRIMTMLDNARAEMRSHLSKLSGGLIGLHTSTNIPSVTEQTINQGTFDLSFTESDRQ